LFTDFLTNRFERFKYSFIVIRVENVQKFRFL